jgi:hypothetical protein
MAGGGGNTSLRRTGPGSEGSRRVKGLKNGSPDQLELIRAERMICVIGEIVSLSTAVYADWPGGFN